MNDDALHSDHELVSAYLDGEASSDERAVVEASPRLQALAASFSSVRGHVADAPIAAAEAREHALAAALAEFDTQTTTTASTGTVTTGVTTGRGATISHFETHRRWQWRLLTGLAAAVVVGIIGVNVLDNTDDNTASTAIEDSRNLDTTAQRAATPTADKTQPRPTVAGISEAAEAVIVVDTPAELMALPTPPPPPTPSDSSVVGTNTPETSTAGTTLAGTSTATPAASGASPSATSGSACVGADQVFLADIIYIDIPAIAVRNLVTGTVQAIDPATCAILAEVTP